MSAGEATIADIEQPARNERPLSLSDLQAVFIEIRDELYRLLRRRTGNAEVAADLTQDIFLKLSAVRAPIPDPGQARAYLFRMAGNLAIDHGRTESRRAEIIQGSEVLFEDTEEGPENTVVTHDQVRIVERVLAELPRKCQEVLILSMVYGLEHKEIASRLGVSVSLVEKYQLRALRHCRDRLGNSL